MGDGGLWGICRYLYALHCEIPAFAGMVLWGNGNRGRFWHLGRRRWTFGGVFLAIHSRPPEDHSCVGRNLSFICRQRRRLLGGDLPTMPNPPHCRYISIVLLLIFVCRCCRLPVAACRLCHNLKNHRLLLLCSGKISRCR